ncbi:MAG: exodeoxyribonuclease VII large subunit [Treponema sp.]|nr:exodeoxyribonuclease VII large subunit [Treponema sp.]
MPETFYQSDTVFTVTQLTNAIKDIVEGSFPEIILEGEISNYRPSSSGHVYFVIKDSGAQIAAVMWKSTAARLNFIPRDGNLVRVKGKLSVYPARGNYQIVISAMDLAGSGNILLMLEERKKKLNAEGLFDESRKKPLPAFPDTIGVVTSQTGAALRDILQITRRRSKYVNVILFPAIVQGETAAPSIVRQIQIANDFKMCDLLIVGRGGGSLEDLLPFSEESVVRAVADSKIPVISAVGHEIDWALCDFAADRRAPTPSAAAEIAVPVLDDVLYYFEQKENEFETEIKNRIKNLRLMIQEFSPENLELKFRYIEQPLLQRFDGAKEDLISNMEERIKDARQKLERQMLILENANPSSLFQRGYSMVRDATTGKIISAFDQVSQGSKIEIIPAKGKILATVDSASNS